MNRIDRITAILIQLQSRKVVKAQHIAERFNISLRTVYRDVKTLEEGGVPVLGEAGVGYSLMEGYRLPPVMFTREEATAFLTAEKMIEKLTDSSTEEQFKSAMYKVRAVLRSSEKDFLETLDDHIEVLKSIVQRYKRPAVDSLQTILKAIAAKNLLRIQYFAHHSQEESQRTIEPVGVFLLENYWHLIAYCRMRKDYRDFRIDRIKSITATEEKFTASHPTLKTYLQQVTRQNNLETVVMRIEEKEARHIDDQKFYNGFVSEKKIGEQIEMTFLTASLQGFARWFLMFGDCAVIVSPQSLKDRISELLTSIQSKLT